MPYQILCLKNAGPDNYSYCEYSIGFNTRGTFSLSDSSGFCINVTLLGVDDSSSVLIIIERKISQFLLMVPQMV